MFTVLYRYLIIFHTDLSGFTLPGENAIIGIIKDYRENLK